MHAAGPELQGGSSRVEKYFQTVTQADADPNVLSGSTSSSTSSGPSESRAEEKQAVTENSPKAHALQQAEIVDKTPRWDSSK